MENLFQDLEINCIICLEECSNNSLYLELPVSTSECTCKNNVHFECLKKNNFKCPICSTQINNYIKFDEVKNYNKKCCSSSKYFINNKFKLKYICAYVILIIILTVIITIISNIILKNFHLINEIR